MHSTRRARRDTLPLLALAAWLTLTAACSRSRPPVEPSADPRAPGPSPVEPNTDSDAGPDPAPEATQALPESSDPELVEDETPHDDAEVDHPDAELRVHPHPLDGWTAERIEHAAKEDIAQLGSLSIGAPSAGALVNGVRAEASELFEPVHAAGAWGTTETLEYLTQAVRKVHEQFPQTPPLSLGHISDEDGGPLRPHLSHQSGRDVDISFYYVDGARWYARANRKNLDLPRTWALVRALITETDVDMILVDHSIQHLLRTYALEQGEDPAWVNSLFAGTSGSARPLIRHAPGHATHLHIRFFNPIAQESARRCHEALVRAGKARALSSFVRHRAKSGDTLGKLAKRYGVTVEAIKAANGLRSSLIRENREYRIPVRSRPVAPPSAPLRFPARRLPHAGEHLNRGEMSTPPSG